MLDAEGEVYKKQLAEAMQALIVPLMDGYDALFAGAATMGKNVTLRIAVKLDVMHLSDIIGIEGQDTFVRPIYAGNAIMTVKSSDAKKSSPFAGPLLNRRVMVAQVRPSTRPG